jgi:hypothetical protein
VLLIGGALGALLLGAWMSGVGERVSPLVTLAWAAAATLSSIWLPVLYLLGALGWGRVLRPLLRRDDGSLTHAVALQWGLGLAAMFTLSHLLGALGAFGGSLGPMIALGVVLAGVGLALHQGISHAIASRGVFVIDPWPWLGVILALPMLLIPSLAPPGWLWGSEFGGYDSLSYHLQLPNEWLASGRLVPLEHNVYSFLPSYIEAAFMHLGAMSFAPPTLDGLPAGLAAGTGWRLIACQQLHALLTVLAAVLCGCAARHAVELCPLDAKARESAQRWAFPLASGIVLFTPWSVVVGSLSYNENAMLALLAAAMIPALDARLAPWRRAILTAVLVGVACGVKPTAMLFGAPVVAIALLATLPIKRWLLVAAVGAAVGLATLSPWMIRNAMHGGNPVFPYAAGVFGSAHWTPEQVQRFRDGHHERATLMTRLALAVRPDATDPAGPRHRGMMHPQWALAFPAAAACLILTLASTRTRRLAVILGAGLTAQLLVWLLATHVQSRFLLPTLLPISMLLGLAAAAPRAPDARAIGLRALLALPIVLAGWSTARIYGEERGGRPNAATIAGPGAFSGALIKAELAAAPPREREQVLASLPPQSAVNLSIPPDARVLLVGDATPLYLRQPLAYATTWDAWPWTQAFIEAREDPAMTTALLRQKGFEFALVNVAEVSRLARSGFADPAVTEAHVMRWMQRGTTLVRAWPEAGIFLVGLVPPEAGVPSP